MSVDSNRERARSWYVQVVGTGNVDRLAEFVSPVCVEVYQNERYEIGLDGARDHVLGIRRAFPDLTITVDLQVAEGDWVATQVTARGTHAGTWLDVAPTNRPMEFTGVNLNRVVNGRIVEHRGAANLLGPLPNAGAIIIPGRSIDEA